MTNLNPDTTYFVRPFATNGIGTSYGPIIEIQTSSSNSIDDLYAMMYEPMRVTGSRHYDFGQKGVDIFTDMVSGDMALSASAYGWYDSTANLESTVDITREENTIISKHYITIIDAANVIIEALTPFGAIPSNDEDRWELGQALAMRAHSYFYLTQCFQESYDPSEAILPLFDGPQYDITPVETGVIYNMIENDLQTAISLLNGFNRSAKKQVDQNVVKMILAYTLAAKGNSWQEVANLTNEVVATTSYTILQSDQVSVVPTDGASNSFNDVSSNSWMWGVDIIEDYNLNLVSWWGQVDAFSYSYAAAGDFKAIDADLFAAIPTDDARKGQFFYNPANQTHLQPFYKFAASGTYFGTSMTVTADYVYMRVEEAYLLNAEANAQAGNTAAAITSLKALLDLRVPSSTYVDTLTGQDLLDEIYLQTRIELWGEGKSYLAMKRNQATVTRGTNHVFRAGESFVHNSDELTFEFNIGSNDSYTPPALEFLDCENMTITNNTPLVLNEQVSDFTFQIPYVTGNGGDYEAADFISSGIGVEGLTASIDAGTFNLYEGVLEFTVTGTPLNYGTAIFYIYIGGRSCQIELDVLATQNCESYETILMINFDDTPEETYWELYSVNDPSNPLFSGGSNGEYTGLTSKLIPFCLDAGDYVLSFFDTNNNGMTSGNYSLYDTQGNFYVCSSPFTNQQISQFTAGVDSNLQQLTLEIQLDSNPEELYWWIEDAAGNVVASPGNYNAYNNPYSFMSGDVVEELCLPDGTYTFYIYDDFGDGGGPLTLTGPSGVIYTSDGAYGTYDSVEFTL